MRDHVRRLADARRFGRETERAPRDHDQHLPVGAEEAGIGLGDQAAWVAFLHTPPVAPSIYYLRAIAPREITYGSMFIGVSPFVICQLIVLVIVAYYPPTALYLPNLLFGT